MEKETDPNFEKPYSYELLRHKTDVINNKVEPKKKKKKLSELFEIKKKSK
tara:strand:+ start:216 stop:365 length:150 start_codon:yes stop_codon:yes gene_type:complete